MKPEFYIVVDIEASGPTPGLYAMLSLGAATLTAPPDTFYITLKPDRERSELQSMKVHGLSMEDLQLTGTEPSAALGEFAHWVADVTPHGAEPVFCAFNAPFDWMFVNDYFHRYLGYNPFGHKALDIKALYMGHAETSWGETSHTAISSAFGKPETLSHHALEDALQEADLLKEILQQIQMN
jgi:ribonuclease T